MTKYTVPPMRPAFVVCPNAGCGANGRIGVHPHHERRYIRHTCGKTFVASTGTMLDGLKYPSWLVVLVVTLLAYGCPIQALVAAFAIDARTGTDWQLKAGRHAQCIHTHRIGSGQVDVGQVQADELYTLSQAGPPWIATAMRVFSRVWLGGTSSWWRDERLIAPVMRMVRAAGPNQDVACASRSMAFGPLSLPYRSPSVIRSILTSADDLGCGYGRSCIWCRS